MAERMFRRMHVQFPRSGLKPKLEYHCMWRTPRSVIVFSWDLVDPDAHPNQPFRGRHRHAATVGCHEKYREEIVTKILFLSFQVLEMARRACYDLGCPLWEE